MKSHDVPERQRKNRDPSTSGIKPAVPVSFIAKPGRGSAFR
ncbi:hypothetical protein ALO75_101781 [Pseudomonas syringae pv. coryli]|uniref:Uncharacterized protein n=1 Tax=Pseudomonas syringae pv. coryli TaxID=317659 RepID=A0A0P9MFS3_9PSED|nr:hypothetical protein ALO75_101781 [Pseudomonas syringae pv. coryli]